MRPLNFRHGLTIVLAATLAAVSGCDRQAQGTIEVVAIGGTPQLADVLTGRLDTADATLAVNAAQGLVRFDARGLIEPGLAETWNVSDDGLSYIFRLANMQWPSGREVTAEQVARILRRKMRSDSNPLKDVFGAVDDVVAMTDRVLEIRLDQPRPHLLQLLAQPEMALISNGHGTGPFAIDRNRSNGGRLLLTREVPIPDEEETEREQVALTGASAERAITAFAEARADLVLGGTFANLPLARQAELPRGALQFDPAIGLFGLVPTHREALLGDPDIRALLSAAIDRQALVEALAVPGLVPRMTVLEPGLDNVPEPQPPDWATTAFAERRRALDEAARRFLPDGENPILRVALPEGPGSEILFERLSLDWGALGIEVKRAAAGERADLKLVDEVAPSTSAAWYLRRFRCEYAGPCDEDVDELLEAARNTPVAAQRSALLAEAARRIDSLQLFLPLAAPIRWSLVSPRVTGFTGNRFAVHTLTGLEQQLERTGE